MPEPIPYNTLCDDDIEIAGQAETKAEIDARRFSEQFPREFQFPANYIQYYWRIRALKREIARIPGFAQRLEAFHQGFGTGYSGGLRMVHICHLMHRLKPKLVTEFGAGLSTVFFGELLRQNQRLHGTAGNLVSYEQSPQFYDRLMQVFPSDLLEFVEIKLEPLRLQWWGENRGIFFDTPIPENTDLMYIDGPTRTRGAPACDFKYRRFNADIVRWTESGCRIGYAFTDHRWGNYIPYKRLLGAKFKVTPSRVWKSIIIEPNARLGADK